MTQREIKILADQGWNILVMTMRTAEPLDTDQIKRIAVGGGDDLVEKHEFKTAYQISKKVTVVYRKKS